MKHDYCESNPPAMINESPNDSGIVIRTCNPNLEVKEFLERFFDTTINLNSQIHCPPDTYVIQLNTISCLPAAVMMSRSSILQRPSEFDDPELDDTNNYTFLPGWEVSVTISRIPDFFDIGFLLRSAHMFVGDQTFSMFDWHKIIDPYAFKVITLDKAGLSGGDMLPELP